MRKTLRVHHQRHHFNGCFHCIWLLSFSWQQKMQNSKIESIKYSPCASYKNHFFTRVISRWKMYEEINQNLRKSERSLDDDDINSLCSLTRVRARKEGNYRYIARTAKKASLSLCTSLLLLRKKSKFFVNSDKQRVMYHFNDWMSSLSFCEAL